MKHFCYSMDKVSPEVPYFHKDGFQDCGGN